MLVKGAPAEWTGAPGCWPGHHFMNNFSIVILIQWKFNSALIQVVTKWSLWNFANGMTAVLSWHVQNFVAIRHPTMTLQSNWFSIKFELRWKNHSWNGPRGPFHKDFSIKTQKYFLPLALCPASSAHSSVYPSISTILISALQLTIFNGSYSYLVHWP